jgi:aminopeptidase N
VLKTWAAQQRNGNGTTGEFIATAEKVSGRDLGALFQTWLFGTKQPPRP